MAIWHPTPFALTCCRRRGCPRSTCPGQRLWHNLRVNPACYRINAAPIIARIAKTDDMSTSEIGHQATETPFRILIVDDVPANLDVLRQLLESEGYQVLLAPNGEVALRNARGLVRI